MAQRKHLKGCVLSELGMSGGFSHLRMMPVSQAQVLDLDQRLVRARQQDGKHWESRSRNVWFDRDHRIGEEKRA